MEIISDGQILPLYDDPDAPDIDNPHERQRYIEATIGAKFEIKVTLTEKFHFGPSQVAVVNIACDGVPACYTTIEKSSWLRSHKNESTFVSRVVMYCPATSTWKSRFLMFGSLNISNDPFLKLCRNVTDCHLLAESAGVKIHSAKLKKLGQIQVTIQRMKQKTLRYPLPPNKIQLTRVAELSEKTLKGSAISSTVR